VEKKKQKKSPEIKVSKDTIVAVDPQVKVKGEREDQQQIGEAAEKTAVFAFGRMNPPTTGHEKLMHAVHKTAQAHGAKGHVVTSHSHDSKKNPLPQDKKMSYLKKLHPHVDVHGSSKEAPTMMHHASKLHAQGHKHLVMVAGSDRTKDFEKTLKKYNGQKGPHGHYDFKSIKVVSSGARDPDSEGVSGMSGTKMRAHAKAGDHESFKKGLPKALHKHAGDIVKHINEGMEDINKTFEELVEVLTIAGRRKKAIAMRRNRLKLKRAKKRMKYRFATKAQLKKRARRAAVSAIKKRVAGTVGKNYRKASAGQKAAIDKRVASRRTIINKIATRNMPKARKSEAGRLKAARSVKEQFETFTESMKLDHSKKNPYPKGSAGHKAMQDIEKAFSPTANQNRRIDLEKKRNADPKFRDFVQRKAMQKRNPDPKVQAAKKAFRDFGGKNEEVVNELSRTTLSNYMRKSAASVSGKDAKTQDKRISGQSMADKKMRKADGYSSTAKVAAEGANDGAEQPKYHAGMSDSTKEKRVAHFKAKKSGPAPGDATAKTKPSKYTKQYHDTYGEGVEMEMKEFFDFIDSVEEAVSPLASKHEREKKQLKIKHEREKSRMDVRSIRREDVNEVFSSYMVTEKSQSALSKKADASGVSVGTLRKVYNRGVAAWKTGHRPGTTPEQWGYARVNAFIAKKKKGNLNHDKDLT
jgi:hypothetical protein